MSNSRASRLNAGYQSLLEGSLRLHVDIGENDQGNPLDCPVVCVMDLQQILWLQADVDATREQICQHLLDQLLFSGGQDGRIDIREREGRVEGQTAAAS